MTHDLTLEQRLARVEAALGLENGTDDHSFSASLTPLTNLVPLRLALTFDRTNRTRKVSFPAGRFSSLRDALTLQLYGSLGDTEVTDAHIEVQVDGFVVKPSTSPLVVIHERDDTDAAGTWRVLSVSLSDSVDLAEQKDLNLVILPWPTDEAMTKRILEAIGRNTRAIASHDHNATYAGFDHRHEGTYQPKGDYANSNHNHEGVYQPKGEYAGKSHAHEDLYQPKGDYAGTNHTHEGTYQPKGDYAGANHTHEGVYQPKGDYSPVNHSHDTRYASVSHSHDNYKIPIHMSGMDGFLTSIHASDNPDNGILRLGFEVMKNGEYFDSLTIECIMKYVGAE